jgi:hypothetical protein
MLCVVPKKELRVKSPHNCCNTSWPLGPYDLCARPPRRHKFPFYLEDDRLGQKFSLLLSFKSKPFYFKSIIGKSAGKHADA